MSPELLNLKNIGLDMEEAIYNRIKNIFANVDQLYCVRHLSQQDEKKLDSLLSKVKCSASQKKRGKIEVLKDIYGERQGNFMNMV